MDRVLFYVWCIHLTPEERCELLLDIDDYGGFIPQECYDFIKLPAKGRCDETRWRGARLPYETVERHIQIGLYCRTWAMNVGLLPLSKREEPEIEFTMPAGIPGDPWGVLGGGLIPYHGLLNGEVD